jgi:hypothetical protein
VSVSSVGVDVIGFVINANCPKIDNEKNDENKGDFHIKLNHLIFHSIILTKISSDQSRLMMTHFCQDLFFCPLFAAFLFSHSQPWFLLIACQIQSSRKKVNFSLYCCVSCSMSFDVTVLFRESQTFCRLLNLSPLAASASTPSSVI